MSYKVLDATSKGLLLEDMERAEREGYRYIGSAGSAVIMHQNLPQWPKDPSPNPLARIAEMLREAVQTDGGHHKQWYLEQVAGGLEVALPDHEEGIAP